VGEDRPCLHPDDLLVHEGAELGPDPFHHRLAFARMPAVPGGVAGDRLRERDPDEPAVEREAGRLGVVDVGPPRRGHFTGPIGHPRCGPVASPAVRMGAARVADRVGRIGSKEDRTLPAHQPRHVLRPRGIAAEKPMPVNLPELARARAPFLLELTRLIQLGRWFHLGMQPAPHVVTSSAAQQRLDRVAVGLHRSQQGRDPRGVGFGQRGERVERQEQLVRFRFRDVEHEHGDRDLRGGFRAEMAVDEHEPSIGQLPGE